ncbi:NB-ARC domain containing protein, expressed [Panicum miliaceum]|uniref:NB-ARC domain containing protein, expressed n=1 Tax=Panicum miliaceum TaxID=4540 RepID=A0A3L6PC23_PANMI|nr:NB-ARC domain containing protein, expressed [Panicum miliaceum]
MAAESITFVLNRLVKEAALALLRGTRDVAHDAEDVLDEFLRKVDLDRPRRRPRSRWGRWLWFATTLTPQVAVRHDLREKMDAIKDRLQERSPTTSTSTGGTSCPRTSCRRRPPNPPSPPLHGTRMYRRLLSLFDE